MVLCVLVAFNVLEAKEADFFQGIHNTGVGEVVIGKPLPKGVKGDYFHGFYADGIAYEGFDLGNPKIRVAVTGGPFLKWDASGPNMDQYPPKINFAAKMAKVPHKDLLVKMIVIDSKGPSTKSGIGVGSTLNDMKKTGKLIGVHHVPPSFGGDRCSAKLKGLENVLFYFKDKKSAETGGKIIRISISDRSY
jgi:hypothetical protein